MRLDILGKAPFFQLVGIEFEKPSSSATAAGDFFFFAHSKIADYFGITVEELMGTKKEPAGMGGLKWEWADVEAAYKNATPEARAAAKAAALAVLENGKAKEE